MELRALWSCDVCLVQIFRSSDDLCGCRAVNLGYFRGGPEDRLR